MNTTAIELNNRGVVELQSGNFALAFALLSEAGKITIAGISHHVHVDSDATAIRFHWEDCSSKDENLPTYWEGSVSFLYIRALRISYTGKEADLDSQCACGLAWCVWFNLALCANVLGSRLGDRGRSLLEVAFDLYHKVQKRIDCEPSSKHWDLLQMAVLNNRACIYRDMALHDELNICLDELGAVVHSASSVEDFHKWSFVLNVEILGNTTTAASA